MSSHSDNGQKLEAMLNFTAVFDGFDSSKPKVSLSAPCALLTRKSPAMTTSFYECDPVNERRNSGTTASADGLPVAPAEWACFCRARCLWVQLSCRQCQLSECSNQQAADGCHSCCGRHDAAKLQRGTCRLIRQQAKRRPSGKASRARQCSKLACDLLNTARQRNHHPVVGHLGGDALVVIAGGLCRLNVVLHTHRGSRCQPCTEQGVPTSPEQEQPQELSRTKP